MRILMLHNRYAQPGGEDVSTANEAAMLRRAGHEVELWEVSSADMAGKSLLSLSLEAVWSLPVARELKARLRAGGYDLLHVQNYFPQFSPVAHVVAARLGIPSIQHLRNYRFTCASANLFRDGRVCHDCVGSLLPLQGIRHKCYRGSAAGSAVVAAMIGVHRLAGTWSRSVTRYIAISEHVRTIHVAAGLPSDRIVVRPNIVFREPRRASLRGADVFVASRLTAEKGVEIAIAAWRQKARQGTLRIAGAGPRQRDLWALAAGDSSIVFLGQLSQTEVEAEMARARAVVVPSLWEEPFGRTALEAMAAGTPVLASAIGGLPEVLGARSPCLFPPGNVGALSLLLDAVLEDERFAARIAYDQGTRFANLFSSTALLRQTEEIYAGAIEAAARLSPAFEA